MSSYVAKTLLKSELKGADKKLKSMAAQNSGPRRRQGTGMGDKVEGCCNRCCGAVCRISPWQQLLCWACVALTVTTIVVWIGGAFLVSPAKNNNAKNLCGTSINIPILNKDGYIFFLGSSGIFVIIMIVASCLCCCSGGCLCSSRMPRGCRICGGVGLFLGALATAVFVAWVALGTYLVLRVRGADTICRNTIAYLSLLYLYLVVLVIVGVIIVIWHCKDWRRGQSDDTGGAERTRTKKKISDS